MQITNKFTELSINLNTEILHILYFSTPDIKTCLYMRQLLMKKKMLHFLKCS